MQAIEKWENRKARDWIRSRKAYLNKLEEHVGMYSDQEMNVEIISK